MRYLWKANVVFRGRGHLRLTHDRITYLSKASVFSSQISKTNVRNYEEERASSNVVLPSKFNFTLDVLEMWAQKEEVGERNSANPAFWWISESGEEIKWNFQELVKEIKKTANVLEQCGVQRGERIFIMLPKIPEFWLVNTAAFRIGCAISPAATMFTAKDLAYRFTKLQPSCLVVHESVADCAEEAIKISNITSVKSKIMVSNNGSKGNKGWVDFELLRKTASSDHQCTATDGSETLLLAFTSGTTGYPKMVEHTQANYCIGMGETAKYMYGLTPESLIWSFCDTGWAKIYYGSLIGPWMAGAGIFIHQMPRFLAPQTLQTLSTYPIDRFCAPPMAYRLLVQEDLAKYKFKKLEHCISGGEALNLEVYNSWLKGTGLNIYEAFGQTETVMLIGMFKFIDYKPGSMGKPAPYVDIAILDDNGNELGPGEQGELAVKLTKKPVLGLFKGYKGNPDLTRQKMTDKYFHLGDVAYRDEDGYYWFVMRKDDQINASGYRIGPFEVENALIEHPAVVEAAVVSSPDPERGEVVKAFVVLTDAYSKKPEQELIKELQEHTKKITAPYKYPRKIEFISSLPKTTSGKVMRYELKQKEWKGNK